MTRYPLAWPDGWKRCPTAARKRAQFHKSERQYSSTGDSSWMRKRDVTIADGTTRVLDALRRFGVLDGDAIISTNLQVRLDGLPRSGQSEPADPGVAVYWTRAGEAPVCMAVDRYDRVADNLAAIAATLEAMRSIERHGGAQILARAFTGFTALPRATPAGRPWREVLGFEDPGSGLTRADVEVAYLRARGKAHPDRPGGSHEAFLAVQSAYEEAQRELGFTD